MRRILLGFITLLMLTPALTCVMAFCPLQSALAAEPKPCHQSEESQKDGQKNGPMFALDCMGVDLFQTDAQVDIVQPELLIYHIDFVWTDITPNYDFFLASSRFIRGPPFDASPPHTNNTDLYLTTQRLRI